MHLAYQHLLLSRTRETKYAALDVLPWASSTKERNQADLDVVATALALVDTASDLRQLFTLDSDAEFPNQTVIRIAYVDWPGYVSFARLRPSHETAVLPLWNLMGDEHTRKSLLACLHNHGIDDFLYKASIFECQKQLNDISQRINYLKFLDIPMHETAIMIQLRIAQQALNRLYRCVKENQSHERAFIRYKDVATTISSCCERDQYYALAKEATEIDETALRAMSTLHMNIAIRDSANSLAQAQSTTRLTWLVFCYAPLSLATSIFGMNLKQINNTGLPLSRFFEVLLGILAITLGFVLCYRRFDRALRARNSLKQLASSWMIVQAISKHYSAITMQVRVLKSEAAVRMRSIIPRTARGSTSSGNTTVVSV